MGRGRYIVYSGCEELGGTGVPSCCTREEARIASLFRYASHLASRKSGDGSRYGAPGVTVAFALESETLNAGCDSTLGYSLNKFTLRAKYW
jgi:hypothetical protein